MSGIMAEHSNLNFEVVVDRNGELVHLYRANNVSGFPWTKTVTFGEGLTQPALIFNPATVNLEVLADAAGSRAGFGTKGNFEVVVPLTRTSANPFGSSWTGLAHFFRNNDSGALPWTRTALFADGDHGRLGLLHSTQFNALELVTWDGTSLRAYFRANQGWQGGSVVPTP